MISALEAVLAVEEARKLPFDVPAAITFWSHKDEWVYTAVYDNKVCDDCLQYEHETFWGDVVRGMFPYYEVTGLERINVNVHPNCRCYLSRILDYSDVGRELKDE